MAKQTIGLGTAPTGVGGDTPRTAFTKVQANFDELYAADAVSYKKTNVLGATTQSGGVVTGALFNSGSNANGFYTFMADGTLICTHRQYVSLALPNVSGAWYYNLASWIFPTAFVSPPKVHVSSWCAGRVISTGRANEPTSSVGTSFFIISSENVPASTFVHEWTAIGRWF
ncbi:hypothetical protein [Pseudomonas gregormendelii]|uniref:hypothetical protein n=1 Tax=Pseudomonas gregormendelii TaxID=1628277 RepID=UPI001F479A95|nr:hypothetical protein [Pseudomonas gregormendelii]